MLIGERVELHQLIIGDDVAGGVRRPRNTYHRGLFADVQMLKIDVIFELAFRQQFNIGARRNEQLLFEAGIRIPDILWCQRKQRFFGRAIRLTTGEQVKQVEKRALTAIC